MKPFWRRMHRPRKRAMSGRSARLCEEARPGEVGLDREPCRRLVAGGQIVVRAALELVHQHLAGMVFHGERTELFRKLTVPEVIAVDGHRSGWLGIRPIAANQKHEEAVHAGRRVEQQLTVLVGFESGCLQPRMQGRESAIFRMPGRVDVLESGHDGEPILVRVDRPLVDARRLQSVFETIHDLSQAQGARVDDQTRGQLGVARRIRWRGEQRQVLGVRNRRLGVGERATRRRHDGEPHRHEHRRSARHERSSTTPPEGWHVLRCCGLFSFF